MNSAIPFRYARALVDLAVEGKRLEETSTELLKIRDVKIEGFKHYLKEVAIPKGERKKILGEVLDGISASGLVRRFVNLLLERGRLGYFDEIVGAYLRLKDEIEGVVRADVVAAAPLDGETKEKVRKLLQEKTGKRVEVRYSEDQSLVGGIVVQMGSHIYDGSVKGELKKIQKSMLK